MKAPLIRGIVCVAVLYALIGVVYLLLTYAGWALIALFVIAATALLVFIFGWT